MQNVYFHMGLLSKTNRGVNLCFPGGVHDAHRGRWLVQERSSGPAEGFLRAAAQRQARRHQEAHQVLRVVQTF